MQTLARGRGKRRKQKGNTGPERYAVKMGEIGRYLYTKENDPVEMEKMISWNQKEEEAGEMSGTLTDGLQLWEKRQCRWVGG